MVIWYNYQYIMLQKEYNYVAEYLNYVAKEYS